MLASTSRCGRQQLSALLGRMQARQEKMRWFSQSQAAAFAAAPPPPTAPTQASLFTDIHSILKTNLETRVATDSELCNISQYYFDGKGKAIRPRLCLTVADAVNHHYFLADQGQLADDEGGLKHNQRQIAIIAEMFHTASLYHDDVIDKSEERRSKESCNVMWGQKDSILSGDYVVAIANKLLGMTRDPDANIAMAQILNDLVVGEFQQMAKTKDDRKDRFQMYIDKTYNKTASLMANSCKAVAILAENSISQGNMASTDDPSWPVISVPEAAFNYGRNVGIAFQLIDDWLDFSSSAQLLGKPAAADLKLGLATAPVLFAADRHPELEPMIKRRFCQAGDVEYAFERVLKSNGLEETKTLAQRYCHAALENIKPWRQSNAKADLQQLVQVVVERMT